MKHILVTGGTGYIGSALVPHLLAQGDAVRVFSRHAGAMPAHTNLSHSIGDIRDHAAVRRAMSGITHVIHLAGVPDIGDANIMQSINEAAFLPLLTAAGDAGVKRFLFLSTAALYGDGTTEPCTEDAPAKPLTPYAAQKLACEKMLHKQCPAAMEYTILRPGAICGMAQVMRMDVLSHLLVRDACSKGAITVMGGGHYRPHLHMADLTRACAMLLCAPSIHGEVFNLASDNLTITALAEKVKMLVGQQVIIHDQPASDNRSYRINSDKIKDRTGFSTLFDVVSALKGIADAITSGRIADPYDLRYYPSKRPQAN